jgi:hypothetical protein
MEDNTRHTVLISPQSPPDRFRTRSGRRRFIINIVWGLAVLIAVPIVIVLLYGSFVKGAGVADSLRVVVYVPGTLDPDRNIDVIYNAGNVGVVTRVAANLACQQMLLRNATGNPDNWECVTFRLGIGNASDAERTATLPGGIVLRYGNSGDVRVAGPKDALFTISNASDGTGRLIHLSDMVLRVNNRDAGKKETELRSGDEIAFSVEPGAPTYILRWNAPGFYTRVDASIDTSKVKTLSLADARSIRVNGFAALNISGLLGLMKVNAQFTPAFDDAVVLRDPRRPLELRSGTGFDMNGVLESIGYLTSHRALDAPPANRFERIASNLDSTIGNVKGATGMLDRTTMPLVNGTITDVNARVGTTLQSMEDKVGALQQDLHRLSLTAERSVASITDTANGVLKGMTTRVDLLMRDIETMLQELNGQLPRVGAGVEKVGNFIEGRKVR